MRRRLSILMALVFLFTAVIGASFGAVYAAEDDGRIRGADRYVTACEIAKQKYSSADTVIIVRGDSDVVDGLTASVLAGAKDAPILLTRKDSLPDVVKKTIEDLGVKNVYIIGGTAAVSEAVEEALKDLGINVERVKGGKRYETAVEVAKKANTGKKTAIVAQGFAPADALVAGSLAVVKGYPILLVEKDKVGAAAEAAIKDLGIEDIIIVGGEAVVSEKVEEDLRNLVSGSVARLKGGDRILTSIEVAKQLDANEVVLVNGWNFVDAVPASVLGLPILYVKKDVISDEVLDYIATKAGVKIIGGTNAISDAVADKAREAVELKIVSVSAVGAKKLQVVFSKAVDSDKAVVKITKGLITINVDKVEFSADKKTAVINTTTDLTKGEYKVIVSGIASEDLVAEYSVSKDPGVAAIRLLSDKAPIVGTVGLSDKAIVRYEVLNQYGEPISGVNIKWTTSLGQSGVNDNTGKLMLQSSSVLTPGQVVYLTGVHVESGTIINTQVTVALPAVVDSIKIKGIYDTVDEKFVDLPANFEDDRYVLLFEAYDQYGNKVDYDNVQEDEIVFRSLNPLLVNVTVGTDDSNKPEKRDVDGTEYLVAKLSPGSYVANGGSATIQAIAVYAGKVATYEINVPALAVVKTFYLYAPTEIVAEGEKVEIPFEAYDQFGNRITSYEVLDAATDANGVLRFTASNGSIDFEKNKDGSAKLVYTAPDSGAEPNFDLPVYISSVVIGGNISNISFAVKDKAVPTVVVGLEGVTLNIMEGASIKIEPKNVKVQDQYGRTFLWKDYEGDDKLELSSGNESVAAVAKAKDDHFVVTAETKGKATLTLSIDGEASSGYRFTVNVVKPEDVVEYEIADVPLMKESAEKTLSISGKLGNGAAVVVNQYQVVKEVVSTNEEVLEVTLPVADDDAVKLTAVEQTSDPEDDVTVKVIITIEGPTEPIVITKEVTISYKAPYAVRIEVDPEVEVTNLDDSDTLLQVFKVIDQYGEEITENKGKVVITNRKDNTAIVTLITPNGLTATTKAIVVRD